MYGHTDIRGEICIYVYLACRSCMIHVGMRSSICVPCPPSQNSYARTHRDSAKLQHEHMSAIPDVLKYNRTCASRQDIATPRYLIAFSQQNYFRFNALQWDIQASYRREAVRWRGLIMFVCLQVVVVFIIILGSLWVSPEERRASRAFHRQQGLEFPELFVFLVRPHMDPRQCPPGCIYIYIYIYIYIFVFIF